MDLSFNELDLKFIVDEIMGTIMFIVGLFFDLLANHFLWQHNEGFSIAQILWCAFWGTYVLWTYFYHIHYGK